MKPYKQILWSSLLTVTFLPATMAWASTSHEMPAAKSVGPLTYVSGGSNQAQAEAMQSAASGYPLELEFFWGRGQKETPIPVQWSIKNAAGHELVDARSSGPEVLASLPNGRYTVSARYDETTLSRVVSVHHGKHDAVLMEWPS